MANSLQLRTGLRVQNKSIPVTLGCSKDHIYASGVYSSDPWPTSAASIAVTTESMTYHGFSFLCM